MLSIPKLNIPNIDLVLLEDNIYFLNGTIKIIFNPKGSNLEIASDHDFAITDLPALKQIIRSLMKLTSFRFFYTTNPFFKKLGFRTNDTYYYTKNPFVTPILEVCTGSYEDAMIAYEARADRIELNSALYLGGLTASLAALDLTLLNTDLEVVTMVRPRGAGFSYSERELEQIFKEARQLLEHGSHGIVFGFLLKDKTIDRINTLKMINLCNEFGALSIFSRAVDVTSDYDQAIQTLVELGVDRILTSGAKASAENSILKLKEIKERYSNRVEFVFGSGIRTDNIAIFKSNHLYPLHATFKTLNTDETTSSVYVDYSYNGHNLYEITDAKQVLEACNLLLEEVSLS